MDAIIERELTEKACRHALWLAILLAQRAGWVEITNQLTSVIAQVDTLRGSSTGESIQ